MKSLNLEEYNGLIKKADTALNTSLRLLNTVAKQKEWHDQDESGGRGKILQLILQYRLDTQDALFRLFQFDYQILKILGIGPEYSKAINLERIGYAVGSEDLHQILGALSRVVDSLLRVANRYQQTHKQLATQRYHTFTLKHLPQAEKMLQTLQQACDQQKLFIALLPQLQLKFEEIIKTEAIEPVYDHIAALRGPISQFFQAEQNGLEIAYKLYKIVNPGEKLEKNVSELLDETHQALYTLSAFRPHFNLTPPPPSEAERLEARATAKRLRPFFASV